MSGRAAAVLLAVLVGANEALGVGICGWVEGFGGGVWDGKSRDLVGWIGGAEKQ